MGRWAGRLYASVVGSAGAIRAVLLALLDLCWHWTHPEVAAVPPQGRALLPCLPHFIPPAPTSAPRLIIAKRMAFHSLLHQWR